MKSVASWHYVMADIRAIRNWNVASVCFDYHVFFIRLVVHTHLMIILERQQKVHVLFPLLFFYPPQIKTMLPGEHQQVLSNLQSHFNDFLADSESEAFTVADCAQLERDVVACQEYYQELLRSAERGKT